MAEKKKDLQEVWDYTKKHCGDSIGDLCNVERGTANENNRLPGECIVCKRFAASALIHEQPGTARCCRDCDAAEKIL